MTTTLFLLALTGLGASSAFARVSNETWPNQAHPNALARADACTLDVVLVTFRDTTDTGSDWNVEEITTAMTGLTARLMAF